MEQKICLELFDLIFFLTKVYVKDKYKNINERKQNKLNLVQKTYKYYQDNTNNVMVSIKCFSEM